MSIIVETNCYIPVYPINKKKISSYLGDFLAKNNAKMPFSFEEIDFEMNVQSLERTFIDKVFAVCDYYLQDSSGRGSRHLYDIYMIMPNINFNDDLKKLINEVRNDRSASKNNPSANFSYDINKLIDEIIKTGFYQKDFNELTKKLLYEDISYDHVLKGGIGKLIKMKIF